MGLAPDLPSRLFALAHQRDAIGDAHGAVDAPEHDRELAHRDLPAAERVEHGVERRLRALRAGDRRQFERDRPAVSARPRPFRDDPHGGGVTALGEVDDPLGRFFRPLRQSFLPLKGLLVARAGRPAGGIAALTWLEPHRRLRL